MSKLNFPREFFLGKEEELETDLKFEDLKLSKDEIRVFQILFYEEKTQEKYQDELAKELIPRVKQDGLDKYQLEMQSNICEELGIEPSNELEFKDVVSQVAEIKGDPHTLEMIEEYANLVNIGVYKGVEFPSLKLALRTAKTADEEPIQFLSDFLMGEQIPAMVEYYKSLEPITAKEALDMDNAECRRVMLAALPPDAIYDELGGETIDTQVVKKTLQRVVINEDNKVVEEPYEIEDEYKLVKVKYTHETNNSWNPKVDLDMYIIMCKDTSTDRRYALYTKEQKDVIKAIANTMMIPDIPEKEVAYYLRQGDVPITILKSSDSYPDETVKLRPMTKDEYLNKLYNES